MKLVSVRHDNLVDWGNSDNYNNKPNIKIKGNLKKGAR